MFQSPQRRNPRLVTMGVADRREQDLNLRASARESPPGRVAAGKRRRELALGLFTSPSRATFAASALGRALAAGEYSVVAMTEFRGASNDKAKRDLGWQLRYPSWRQGSVEGLG